MKRWRCPKCGSGCLAPKTPRRDDLRKYCLDCSKKTGRLVERVLPSAVARRTAREMKRTVTAIFAKHRKQWKEDDYWTVAGVHVRETAKRYWKVLSTITKNRRAMPTITLRRSRKNPLQETGRASDHRVVMTFGTHVDRAAVEITLLHELSHSSVGQKHNHDEVYNRAFVRASKELFDIGAVISRGYLPTRFIEDALRRRYQEETT